MHPLLGLFGVLAVVLAGVVALGVLRLLHGWSRRRLVQLAVLAMPVAGLGLAFAGLHHFTGRVCFLGAPPWDYRLGLALPLVMGLTAIGGIVLGILRIMLMQTVVARKGTVAGQELQARAARLAEQIGAPRPRVRLYAYERPLAITHGLLRPTVLLSTWMVERLDHAELDSVLAHELAHAARRDYLVAWLATTLRDAFWYLPTSRFAFAQLQREKESACDELAVRATGRPLALASALGKVWQHSLGTAPLLMGQALTGAPEAIERRIERLLAEPQVETAPPGERTAALGLAVAGLVALAGIVAFGVLNTTALFTAMGCGPGSPLWKLIA